MELVKKIMSGKGIKSQLIIDSNVIIDTFDSKSDNYEPSLKFMNIIATERMHFLMPAHGWFEITCNLKKISQNRGIIPPFFNGSQSMLIEFIHIDDDFILTYSDVDIPFIKAKDHIFLVVAKKNNIPLITWDQQMTTIGKSSGIRMISPTEWMMTHGRQHV
jgi:predicted nucleic acid-binding protein